ncbi:hypothetical protein [Spirillospora sp. NPDC029432]|uniref:hypothetical protein n=1 Tax=Spirillospora sp. NPDC029432 TaxID=3154599 RepID=UPI003455F11D
MTRHPDPAHGDDGRLAEALRAGRPGAIGHVYNVYGPHLFEYADVLLGDRDLAVDSVRAALIASGADPAAVPDPDRFRSWLYGLVRDECLGRLGVRPEEPVTLSGRLAAVGASAEQATVGHVLQARAPVQETAVPIVSPEHRDASAEFLTAAALEATGATPVPVPAPEPRDGGEALGKVVAGARAVPPAKNTGTGTSRRSGPFQVAAAAAAAARVRVRRARFVVIGAGAAAAVALTGLLVLAQSPEGGPPPAGAAAAPASSAPASPPPASPSPSRTPKAEKSEKPERTKARTRPATSKRGRLSISDSGCRGIGVAGLGGSCTVRLTARGGPVRWSVASVDGLGVSASGGGSLAKGRTATVTVRVRPSIGCYARGGGTGSVSFAPGGSAAVSFTCWRR